MRRCAVLLRGINVGRNNRLAMADLRAVLEGVGCRDVTTYLQSGNAVVEAGTQGLAARVEAALPLPVRVVVVPAARLAATVAGCPWPDRADAAPKLVHVTYLDRDLTPDELAPLVGSHGEDELVAGDRVLYQRYAASSLDSPLAKLLARPRPDVVLTARNWTTVTRLAVLAGG